MDCRSVFHIDKLLDFSRNQLGDRDASLTRYYGLDVISRNRVVKYLSMSAFFLRQLSLKLGNDRVSQLGGDSIVTLKFRILESHARFLQI